MATIRWNDRSTEDQSLFNPAFCSLLLRSVCKSYSGDEGVVMPLPLAFLILPIILDQSLRNSLPTMKTMMATWIASNPDKIAGFGGRAKEMANVTKEAINFGSSQGWLSVSGTGISVGAVHLRPDPPKLVTDTADTQDCYAVAKFLGRWFPKGEPVATIMSLLGVAP